MASSCSLCGRGGDPEALGREQFEVDRVKARLEAEEKADHDTASDWAFRHSGADFGSFPRRYDEKRKELAEARAKAKRPAEADTE